MYEPQDVDPVRLIFAGNVIGTLLPLWEDIPEDFRRGTENRWYELAGVWFFRGLEGSKIVFHDGIDPTLAFRHLGVCLRSFEPKHEHKMAGVGYLLYLWCERVTLEDGTIYE